MTMLVDVIRAWAADPNAGPFIPRTERVELSIDEWMHEIANLFPISTWEIPAAYSGCPDNCSDPSVHTHNRPANMGRVENGEPIIQGMCTRCGAPGIETGSSTVDCVQRRRSQLSPRVEYNGLADPDPLVMICLDCLRNTVVSPPAPSSSYNRPPRGINVYSTPFNPRSVLSRLLDPWGNRTATGAMIEDANRFRPRFDDYADESTAVSAGQELANAVLGERPGVLQGEPESASDEWWAAGAPHDIIRSYYGDGRGTLAWDVAAPGSDRPHRRVRPGLCRCNYSSVFSGDMDRHIECANAPLGPSQMYNFDGVPRRWMPCDRCFDYGSCREVRSSVYQPPGGHIWYATTPVPEPPSTVSSYRCDECIDAAR